MLITTITSFTTDAEIETAILPLDMRRHATEQRDYAISAQLHKDETVLEYHEIDGVSVLYSPTWDYAYVNEMTSGVGNSLVIDNDEADGPDGAAKQWAERNTR